MFFLKFEKNSLKIKDFRNIKFKTKYFNNTIEAYFVGNFRNSLKEINSIIENFEEKSFSNKNLNELFKKIDGICTLVLISNEKIIVTCSILNSWLKIFSISNDIIITSKERIDSSKLSDSNSFLKLFSRHVYFFHTGIYDALDFICPGSSVVFEKKKETFNFNWYLDFEKFCSRDDHENIANDLANRFVEIFDNFDKNNDYSLSLSGGIDSALLLAAASKTLNVKSFHECRNVYSDELGTARLVSKFFKSELKTIYPFKKNKFFLLNRKDNLENYLDYSYKNLKKDSVYFFLDNGFVSTFQFLNKGYFFGGDAFPMELTLDHMMSYPQTRGLKDWGFEKNKNLRYFYSIDFLKKIEKKNPIYDIWGFGKKYPNIHSYYHLILSMFIEQEPRLISKYLSKDLQYQKINVYSPIDDINQDQDDALKDIKKQIAYKLIDKILKSEFFKLNLQKPNARVAQILFKMVRYLGRTNKENHQAALTSYTNKVYEPIGLNSKTHLLLLETLIDDKLENFAKWHVFRAFEILSGKKFEEIYYYPSLKHMQYTLPKINLKIQTKLRKLPEHDDYYSLINNRYLHEFIDKTNIKDKYNDYKTHSNYKKYFYDFPSDYELNKIENTQSNFWKINNIFNILSNYS